MKKIKNLLVILLLLLSLYACKDKEIYEIASFDIEKEKIVLDDICNLGNKFTISFWILNNSNYVGSEILSIDSNGEKVILLNNSENEEASLTGLTLAHNNGLLYKDSSNYLKVNTYNYVVIEFDRKYFSLYLNGELLGKMAFSKTFRGNNLKLSFGSDNLSCRIDDLILYNYIDTENIVNNIYKDNKLFKIDISFDEEFLNNAKGKIRLPRSKEVDYSVKDGASIEDGFLIFEENNTDEDRFVTLVATYNNNSKEFVFNVRGNNLEKDLLDAYNAIYNNLEYIVSESDYFDSVINGYKVSYEIVSGRAKFIDNHFIKDEDASEKEKCTINVNIGNKNFSKDIVLLDEYYAYLIAGFTGSAFYPDYVTGDEKLYFALSKDLINWESVDINIDSNLGSNRLRDPYISRDKNGNYILMATQGYKYKEIYFGSSYDLFNYDIKLKDFNYYDKDLNIGGNYTWAPEFIYDIYNDQYVIIYSDSEKDDCAIYAVTTKDFETFSYPYIFFDTAYKIIDADIELINGKYYLFYKDESDRGYGKLYYALCDRLTSDTTWRIYDDVYSDAIFVENEKLEGPFAFKDINGTYYLCGDAFGYGEAYYGKINLNGEKIDVDLNKMTSKQLDGIHHFSIIKLTKKEYERILKK